MRENIRIAVEIAAGYRLRPWLGRQQTAAVKEQVDEVLELVGLAGKAQRLVGELSHGDQRAAEIAMALALKPRLLLLDEPTAGMGDQETYEITSLIRRLHRDSRYTIVLIEHDMRVVFHLADRIDGAGPGAPAGRGHAAGDRRQRGGTGRLSGEDDMNALDAEGLHTFYGKSHILHDVRLRVAEGKITTLLGRNGAGKTTTLRSLMGLTPARHGKTQVPLTASCGWMPIRSIRPATPAKAWASGGRSLRRRRSVRRSAAALHDRRHRTRS